jgi:ribosomal protein L7/L12
MIDYTALSDEHRSKLTLASHNFLKTLAEISDAETANEMWGALADHIHPNLKNDLLMLMLTGSLQKIVITNLGPNMIDCIKAIRTHTNLGLKEAKDIADNARYRGKGEVNVYNPVNRLQLAEDLRRLGCEVID